jgi:hypothetical protein
VVGDSGWQSGLRFRPGLGRRDGKIVGKGDFDSQAEQAFKNLDR